MTTITGLRPLALLLALAWSLAGPLGATSGALAQSTGNGKSYLMILDSSDMPVAGAALHLAIQALKSGRQVQIALLADGVALGRVGAQGPDFAAYRTDGPGMLEQAMVAGAKVTVCQICLANQGLSSADFIAGVVVVNAFDVLDKMEAVDIVLSFGAATPVSQITIAEMAPLPATVPDAGRDQEEKCDPATDIDMCM